MALVGSRVELDADEVRRQAERAGAGARGWGGRGKDAETRGVPTGREGGQGCPSRRGASRGAGQRSPERGSAARSRPEPSWSPWVFAERFWTRLWSSV